MAGTFALGLALAPMWLKWRNLWPMAFAHGWLGTAIYYFVMLRDPMSTYLGH
jgi:membrane protease YdiL (CAAX protease family)